MTLAEPKVQVSSPTLAEERPIAAAAAVLAFALLIGFVDNFVRAIAKEASLWQFHTLRSAMALSALLVLAPVFRLRLKPQRLGGVVARSSVNAAAMLIYFGCLGFLPVAQVAAGLFTAPIFVLLFGRLFFGHRLCAVHIVAVALGFGGVLLVLGPGDEGLGLWSLAPVAAGAFYALTNLATREWCAGESAETLVFGFLLLIGVVAGVLLLVTAVLPQGAEEGPAAFLTRPPSWPSKRFLLLTALQAFAVILGLGLLVRAYQWAEASRVAVLEYAVLPSAIVWTWALWKELPEPRAYLGMAAIVCAGFLILRPRAKTLHAR